MDNNKDNIIDNLCKNTDIKNLINLSTYDNNNMFDNNKKSKYQYKSKKKCNNKETINVSNLAKLNTNDNKIENIKEKYIECYSNE
jgi:hypothetical protein